MATLKEDPNSWRARGIIKRDFQHSHSEPEVSKPSKGKNKKKGRKDNRWCGQKEGIEHKLYKRYPSWVDRNKMNAHYEIVCSVCGVTSWKLPDEAKAQIDPSIAKRLALAEKWCQKGHLYDTVEYTYSSSFGVEKTYTKKVCVMCGRQK